MTSRTSNSLNTALRRILKPLIRLLLRNGVAYADFVLLVRKSFVDVASEEFDLPGRKQSVSRIAVLTGINRKEVKRLLEEHSTPATASENNRAARVVSGWMRDSEFQDSNGSPLPLPWGNPGTGISFENLVKHYSGDMPARSILDELRRVGAATLTSDNVVQLTASGYVPFTSNKELLQLSGDAVGDLLNTIDHNLSDNKTSTRLQLSVAYDDVPEQGVELFRSLSKEKSHEFLSYLDRFLATHDRSVNPSVTGEGRYRTGIGVYYFEEPIDEPIADDDVEPS